MAERMSHSVRMTFQLVLVKRCHSIRTSRTFQAHFSNFHLYMYIYMLFSSWPGHRLILAEEEAKRPPAKHFEASTDLVLNLSSNATSFVSKCICRSCRCHKRKIFFADRMKGRTNHCIL